ncbi:MAG TPA: hypothetical protein PLH46_03030 [Caldisericia bacterium]|nr:hypothetical protein [Caldisericia bacterium]
MKFPPYTFYHIEIYENYWTSHYSEIILFDIDNLILNHNGKNYFPKLNSILERKFK